MVNKGILAVAVAGVLAGGAVGAAVYTDGKIKDMYNPNGKMAQMDKRLAMSNTEVNMGLTGGTGKWTASYTLDLCQPEYKVVLRGEDTIKRGLSGYTILSKVYYVPENGKEIFIGDSENKISFGGGMETTLTHPRRFAYGGRT